MIVYKTTNLINGKIYIGKACGKRAIENYLGSGRYFKRAVAKYGKENFRRITIDIAENREDQNRKEIFWIDFYDARNSLVGYNVALGGEGGLVSEEHKEKLRKAKVGVPRSEETKRKLRIAMLGRKNLQHSIRMTGSSHPMYGKHHSKETKQKIIENHKGTLGAHFSDETRKNMSISMTKWWAARRLAHLHAGG